MRIGQEIFSVLSVMISVIFVGSPASASFTGGACISQGSWLQAAMNQASTVTSAINSLKNDPNCQLLVKAVENSPKFKTDVSDAETSSFANMHRELQAISDFMKPSRLENGLEGKTFRSAVFDVVFNKSFESIRNIHGQADLAIFNNKQRDDIKNVSLGLKAFLGKSVDVANVTIATTKNLLAAIPASRLCLDNRPSETAAIFGAVANAATALITGGQISGVGELTASILQFSREMKYVRALSPIEHASYMNSVSCLLESTAEAYCAVQDAEDSLDFLKGTNLTIEQKSKINEVVKNPGKDSIASPLGGLIIMMRDIPIMQAWMQRVLFGVDPRLSIEAKMKNEYWDSYLGFVKKVNSALGNFRDKESLYFETTAGKSHETKITQVREIFDTVLANIGAEGRSDDDRGAAINFFTRSMQPATMRFFLLGYQSPPAEFIEIQSTVSGLRNQFENWWEKGTSSQSGVFADPDIMVRTIRAQLTKLIERAQGEANSFFAKRMVVDPQNLLAEAMKGPGITPYQAFINLRNYYANLADRLEARGQTTRVLDNRVREIRRDQLLAHVPLLRNSVARIDRILGALKSVSKFSMSDRGAAKSQSEEVMGIVYEAAYMLVARDSFFGTRMQTALGADLSDTMWNKDRITDRQMDYFMSVAPDIVSRLAGYFTSNPVLQRSDISSAKLVHIANLESTEMIFSKVLFARILDIDCKLYGGEFCVWAKREDLDPSVKNGFGTNNALRANTALAGLVDESGRLVKKSSGALFPSWGRGAPEAPTEDSQSHHFMRAKLCVQALAFESRDLFKSLCAGARLVSEFEGRDRESANLSMSFAQRLGQIHAIAENPQRARPIDASRGYGVCSFRAYLRKNQVYHMYRESLRAD